MTEPNIISRTFCYGMSTIIMIAAVLGLVGAPTARAATPSLLAVDQIDRRASAQFSAPQADFATIYFATGPERATDGAFFDEQIADSDMLTSDELAAGRWSNSNQIDPGHYWVAIKASGWPSDGEAFTEWSNVMELDVPIPPITFSTRAAPLRNIRILYLTLEADPLGTDVPYSLCWRTKAKKTRCVKSTLEGSSWNSAATDEVRLSMRSMPARTTFRWRIRGHVVATRVVRT